MSGYRSWFSIQRDAEGKNIPRIRLVISLMCPTFVVIMIALCPEIYNAFQIINEEGDQ